MLMSNQADSFSADLLVQTKSRNPPTIQIMPILFFAKKNAEIARATMTKKTWIFGIDLLEVAELQ